jgi:hypothetical protein
VLLTYYDVAAETNYLAATVDKHRRLHMRSAPRVILVGGSNVAFGFESNRMESALGRPFVNMGLAAGLGVEFMLAEIEPALRPGDVVVLSLEYDHFARGPAAGRYSMLGFDPNVLRQVLIFRPEGCLALGWTHLRKVVLDRGLSILGEIARRGLVSGIGANKAEASETQSPRKGFNAWGDLVGHRNEPARTTAELVNRLPLIADARRFPNAAALEVVREFVERTGRLGVRVAFTFTPKPTGTIFRDGELAGRLAEALRQIPGVTLLDAPQDHAYPPEQFFDSANHLTAEGAAQRTSKVIASLEEFLVKSSDGRKGE